MKTCKLIALSSLIGVSLTVVFYVVFAPQLHLFVTSLAHIPEEAEVELPSLPLPVDPESFKKGVVDDAVAKDLYNKVRIYCFIPVAPRNLETKALAVKETWIKNCNKYAFFSSKLDKKFPTIKLEIGEGLDQLTSKVMASFTYVYENHGDNADWFVKADDDTYMIIENLRYLLSHYDPNKPLYFGHHFKMHTEQGYMSGGSGYVLSKEALRRLIVQGLGRNSPCRRKGGAEDAAVGKCLELLDVKPGLSLDAVNKETFHPFNPKTHFYGLYPKWYKEYVKYSVKSGLECCSEFTISYHFVDHEFMRIMHYLIYHTQVYGIKMGLPDKDVFLRQ